MKQAYRVVGRAAHPLKAAQEIDTTVNSTSEAGAIKKVAAKLDMWAVWITDPVAYPVALTELEAQALADWNAGKPTASPLALATARGEL